MPARALLSWLVLLVALGGGATLTLVRVLQPDQAWARTAIAVTPLAVPAYVVVLVWVLWRVFTGRRRWVALLLVPMAGLALHGWWLAPLWTGAEEPGRRAGRPGAGMTVMTAGMNEGAADHGAVVELVSDHDVDLLALQDVTPRLWARLERAGLAELLPHRAGGPATGPGGTVLLSRAPVADHGGLPTGRPAVVAGTTLAGEALSVLAVRVRPLDDPRGWAADHRALRSAARRGPDLVVGDLNATADHEELGALADLGLRDAAELADAGWQPTWPADLVPLAALDHVLAGPRLAVLSSETAAVPGSDHDAVIARLALK